MDRKRVVTKSFLAATLPARRHRAVLGSLLIAVSAAAHPRQPSPPTPIATPAATASLTAYPLDLQLEVFLNGAATGWIVPIRRMPNGSLRIADEELAALGLLPAQPARRADGWIDLNRLPGVRADYNKAAQTLHIQAQDAAMQVRILGAQRRREPSAPMDAPFGAYLNHTLGYTSGGSGGSGWRRFQGASALMDMHVFGRFGVLSSAQVFHMRDAQPRHRSIRLDTQWTYVDPQHLVTYSAGDFISSSLPWSRSARLAGFQIRRNFGIRPDLVTMPLLADLTGSAAVPSTVEVYVNNARRFTQDVAPGPFAVTDLPMITGAGTARLVVRDALGRETVSETPFYASSRLLAQGLTDFALEAGVARHNFGSRSHDYDTHPVGAGVLRYGLNHAVTLEGHAQAGTRFYQVGAGGVFKLGALGVATLSAATSRYHNPITAQTETGQQISAGLEAQWRGFSLFANTQRTFGDVNDLASVTLPKGVTAAAQHAARAPRHISQVSLALPPLAGVSLNVSYTPMRASNGARTRMLGVNSSLRLGRYAYLSVSGYRDVVRRHSAGVFATLSFLLDDHLSASSSLDYNNHRSSAQVQLAKSAQDAFGSIGWRLRTAHGPRRIAGMDGSYRSRIGKWEAGVERFDHAVNGRVQFDGSMVLAGGGVFLANRIDNAFGVVNTGAPNVPVHYQNRPIGNTDANGQLLLTGLRPFEDNLITIDPMDLPVDARADVTRLIVNPPWRSGVVADFPVQLHPRTALVTLRDGTGAFIPAGSSARLNSSAQTIVVGHEGQVYLEGLATDNRLVVTQANKPDCAFAFAAPQTLTERLVIANAICRSVP